MKSSGGKRISANEGLEAVARGEADFGINFIGASHPDIDFMPLAEDPFVLACRRDHPLASRQQVTWKELEPHRVITVGRTSGAYVHETDRHFHQSGHLRFNRSRHFARAAAGPAPWGGARRWRLT